MSLTNTATHRVNDEDMARRAQERELLWQCRDQMDARRVYEHERAGDFLPIGDSHAGIVGYAAGELDGLGVEAADAPRVTGAVPPIVTTELRPVPRVIDWQGVVIALAVAFTWIAVVYLSTADPRDLSSFWPRVLAALSL